MTSTSRTPLVQLRLLGTLDGQVDGRPLDLGPPRRRAVLAVLLAHAGRPVTLEGLVDALWPDDPPGYAVNVVHKHVGALRRLVEPELPRRAQGRWLLSTSRGYRIDCEQASVDVATFHALVADAARAEEAAERLSRLVRALDLWRGAPADGIDPEARRASVFAQLDREHGEAVVQAAGLAGRLGLLDRVLPALTVAAQNRPTDELVHAHLLRALASVGRRAEALAGYERLRGYLGEELGVEPGEALRAAYLDILRDDDASAGAPASADTPPALPAPAQVPADRPGFTGRDAELDALHRGLREDGAAVVAVTGPPGVGKTSLAVRFANQLASSFPDGRLYVDLRGFDPHEHARSPDEVLSRFLEALDVPAARVPANADARAALFRSVVADRRVLVLLDNASSTEQVRPLLPGGSRSLVVVTSRVQLRGLAADGGQVLALDRLDLDASRDFLAARLGTRRVDDEPEAARRLAARCAGLPLALALVAARIAHLRGMSLRAAADAVGGAAGVLDIFTDRTDPRTDIRSVFSWSYDALGPDAARAFRLLALLPGPTLTAGHIAALTGLDAVAARRVLDELEEASLVTARDLHRYDVHDLLRVYAADLLAEEPVAERDAAEDGLYAHVCRVATAATNLHTPYKLPPIDPELAGVEQVFPDATAARLWLDRYLEELVELVLRPAAAPRQDARLWLLACITEPVLSRRGQNRLALQVHRVGLDAAARTDAPVVRAWLHRGSARSLVSLGETDRIDAHIDASMALLDSAPHATAALCAELYRQTGWILEQAGRLDDALDFSIKALNACTPEVPDRTRADALNGVAWHEILHERYDSAFEHAREAEATLAPDPDPDPFSLVDILVTLASLHERSGRRLEALSCHRRAVALAPRLGYPLVEAERLVEFGRFLVTVGHPGWARDLYARGHRILSEIGDPDAERVRATIAELDGR